MLPRIFYDSMFPDFEIKGMQADVYVKDNCYHVELDIPGFKKEDINIEMHKGNLIIKAEKETKEESDDKKYIRQERKYNKIERSFYFSDIDEDSIKADFKDGTLHIVLGKKQEEEKRQITID